MKKLLALFVIPGVLVFFPGCGPTTTPPAAPPKTGTESTSTPPAATPKTTKGKVVKHDGDTLTVKGEKEEHKFTIGKAEITGGKAEDLKEGVEVTVIHKGEAASKVEIAKKADVPPLPADKPTITDGKFVSYKDDKLTLMVGEKETPFDVKGITPKSDGKDIKWDELKKDDKVTVTTEKDKVKSVEKAK